MNKITMTLAVGLMFVGAEAMARSCSSSITFENDLLFTDRNYTSAVLLSHSCTVSASNSKHRAPAPDHPWIAQLRSWNNKWLTRVFGVSEPDNRVYSHHAGLSLYTPNSLNSPRPGKEDGRPYASIFIYGDSVLHANHSFAIKMETQIGLLGIPLGGAIQDAVHDVIGGDDPRGWSTEISRGGEPVLGFALQGKSLLCESDGNGSCVGGWYDATAGLAGSLGYFTSMRAGFSGRIGKIDSPFWGNYGPIRENSALPQPFYFSPLLDNADGQGASPRSLDEIYLFGNTGVELVLYSAVLQGQFRKNHYEVKSSDMERAVPYASVGGVMRFGSFLLSLSHSIRGPEIQDGKSHRWTGVSVGYPF